MSAVAEKKNDKRERLKKKFNEEVTRRTGKILKSKLTRFRQIWSKQLHEVSKSLHEIMLVMKTLKISQPDRNNPKTLKRLRTMIADVSENLDQLTDKKSMLDEDFYGRAMKALESEKEAADGSDTGVILGGEQR